MVEKQPKDVARVDLSIRSCIPPAQARLSVVFSANEVLPFLNSHQSQTSGECGGGVDLPKTIDQMCIPKTFQR